MAEEEEVRPHVLGKAREQIHGLARAGLTADEIQHLLDGQLNETERDLVWLLARDEVERSHAAEH
jgi:hypothetical protein